MPGYAARYPPPTLNQPSMSSGTPIGPIQPRNGFEPVPHPTISGFEQESPARQPQQMRPTNPPPKAMPAPTQHNPQKYSPAAEALRKKAEALSFTEWESEVVSAEVAQVIEKAKKLYNDKFYEGIEMYREVEWLKTTQYQIEQQTRKAHQAAGGKRTPGEEQDAEEVDERPVKKGRQS
jgi:hypothetical protein